MQNGEMLDKVRNSNGFIAALDQSGGSTPGALKGYGYKGDEWSSDEEMYDLVHKMRVRIISSPVFNGEKVLGAILFERTMDGEAHGKPVAEYLWSKGVVPFLKIDKGLADEANGVQLMKPMPELDSLLARGVEKGIFGTKERSVIHLANPAGIAEVDFPGAPRIDLGQLRDILRGAAFAEVRLDHYGDFGQHVGNGYALLHKLRNRLALSLSRPSG